MELQYFGANCLRLNVKKASLVIDDNLQDLGAKPVTKNGDIALFSGPHGTPAAETKLVIDHPGEYEVSEVSIQGIAARAHTDEEGAKTATIFKVVGDDIRLVVTGHVFPELSDDQLEAIGTVDVLVIPVGGNGYTLDATGALKIMKKIEPKIVIPTHYADTSLDYPVPQQELETALKELAMEPKETVSKLKIKANDIGETTELIVLERQ